MSKLYALLQAMPVGRPPGAPSPAYGMPRTPMPASVYQGGQAVPHMQPYGSRGVSPLSAMLQPGGGGPSPLMQSHPGTRAPSPNVTSPISYRPSHTPRIQQWRPNMPNPMQQQQHGYIQEEMSGGDMYHQPMQHGQMPPGPPQG